MSDKHAEALARQFHETYERLAPSFGYTTREASAKPWDQVPEQNRALMVAVAAEILKQGVGKQPHGVEPGRWVPIADAGTGGPC